MQPIINSQFFDFSFFKRDMWPFMMEGNVVGRSADRRMLLATFSAPARAPVIREVQQAGATWLREIADVLNAREVSTA
jgi:hypothetical protein